MKKKNILQIKKIYNNDLLSSYNVPFAKRKADFTNNLIIMYSYPALPLGVQGKSASLSPKGSNGEWGFGPSSSVKQALSSAPSGTTQPAIGINDLDTRSKWTGVAEHNSFMKLVGEMVKSIQDLNSLSSANSQPNVKDEGDASISINKNILPYFSIPVILKKISDQKKNENLNLLNPQTKLVYKIIKLNTKLVEFTTNIKKYNFNLNSFKGNNLDFILFIKNNLYYNLKYRLSNISYKIEKFVPVFKLYSLLNNINLFSPKRLLKPQPYIRFSYRLRYITKITKPILPLDNMDTMRTLNAKAPASSVDEYSKEMQVKGLDSSLLGCFAAESRDPRTAHQIMEINGRAINYLLVKLNNLANEIGYIINIKNKFIKLIKFLKIINIESRLDGSLLTFSGKEDVAIVSAATQTPVESRSNLPSTPNICPAQPGLPLGEGSLGRGDKKPALLSIQGQPFREMSGCASPTPLDDLYLQITKGTDASLTENKIKIEKTIKSMCTSNDNTAAENASEIRWDRYLNSLENSVKSNPVDILYFNNNLNRPIINQYLKSMSMYNMITKGTMMFYSKFIGFNLFSLTPSTTYPDVSATKAASSPGSAHLHKVTNSVQAGRGEMQTNKLIKNIYKFLYSSFRSMYCLISKPVFIFKANKIIIQLFYFILIPKILKYKKKNNFYYLKKKNEKGKINDIFKFNKKEDQTSASHEGTLGLHSLRRNLRREKKNQYVWFTHKKNKHKNVIFPKTNFNFNIKSHRNLLKKFNKIKQDKKKFQLIKLANVNIINVYPLKFEKLCEVLNKFFKKPVELDLIRLQYPYNDSNILVRLLAFMVNKIKLRKITRRLFKNAVLKSIKKINNKDEVKILPAFLSGMTIKVAGRLMKYKVIPRKTVKIIRRGSSSVGKINYSDISRYTNKNKRGAFSITVKSGQNFF